MSQDKSKVYSDLLQLLEDHGPDAFAAALTELMSVAVGIERNQEDNVRLYEDSDDDQTYANVMSPKQAGLINGYMSHIPKPSTSSSNEDRLQPYVPKALERGTRAFRAMVSTLAEIDTQGVSTRDVNKVMTDLRLQDITPEQIRHAAASLDLELKAWRNRPLGETPYLLLDARYQQLRYDGVIIDVALFSAIGISPDGKRRVLGTSVSRSEAESHWREFLNSLITRGMHGVTFITSDNHPGLEAARSGIFPDIPWQRCQNQLANHAAQQGKAQGLQIDISERLRSIFNARDRDEAEQLNKDLIEEVQIDSPDLSLWLESNISATLSVFKLQAEHHKKMRTTKGIERPIQQQLKKYTRNIRVFPNIESLLRLATAILVEIDDEWTTATKRYITWQDKMTR